MRRRAGDAWGPAWAALLFWVGYAVAAAWAMLFFAGAL